MEGIETGREKGCGSEPTAFPTVDLSPVPHPPCEVVVSDIPGEDGSTGFMGGTEAP